MSKRHKWADIAIAFAEGNQIQWERREDKKWIDWEKNYFPAFFDSDNWRIKPTETVVRWQWIYKSSPDVHWLKSQTLLTDAEAKAYFGPTMKMFKDEASRVEFPAEDV